MQDKPYEIQSDFIRRYFDEGNAEGMEEGKADIVRKLGQFKFGSPNDAALDDRGRIRKTCRGGSALRIRRSG